MSNGVKVRQLEKALRDSQEALKVTKSRVDEFQVERITLTNNLCSKNVEIARLKDLVIELNYELIRRQKQ